MALIRMRRSGSGHGSGAGGGGIRERIMRSSRSVVSAWYGCRPVTISYSITASDQRSESTLTSPVSSRSGEA